jgi:transcriptional regulator with GAF, ATPase, and Fis domain
VGRPGPEDTRAQGDLIFGAALQETVEGAERVAASRIPVLLNGETGTGKEVIAHLIHERSPRAGRPLVRVNCAAIPAQLVESTLFGHERGAFTGAAQQHKGVFEEGHGGTVFLDEIGELPLTVQAALLRVLETQSFHRVGSSHEVHVDVRILAATHRDLEAMIARGEFRSDLYYRLSTVVLRLPPLRERRDEIEPLALRFLTQANAAHGRQILGITPDALELLQRYPWPGNVRELKNAIERATVLARADVIRPQDLPECLRRDRAIVRALPMPDASPPLTPAPPSDARKGATEKNRHLSLAPPAPGELRTQIQQYEARIIRETLAGAQWNRAVAAQRLGMPLRTLAHKIKTLDIKKPAP